MTDPRQAPLEAIDRLSDQVAAMVHTANTDRRLTAAQFAAAHARAMREALPVFLDSLRARLGAGEYEQFRRAFLEAYEATKNTS